MLVKATDTTGYDVQASDGTLGKVVDLLFDDARWTVRWLSTLATTLQAFFTDRLIRQRQVSPNTVQSYRDTLRLLLVFAAERHGKAPGKLGIDDLDAPIIGAFLDHLEDHRKNGVRTRNARLAAIRSLFRPAPS